MILSKKMRCLSMYFFCIGLIQEITATEGLDIVPNTAPSPTIVTVSLDNRQERERLLSYLDTLDAVEIPLPNWPTFRIPAGSFREFQYAVGNVPRHGRKVAYIFKKNSIYYCAALLQMIAKTPQLSKEQKEELSEKFIKGFESASLSKRFSLKPDAKGLLKEISDTNLLKAIGTDMDNPEMPRNLLKTLDNLRTMGITVSNWQPFSYIEIEHIKKFKEWLDQQAPIYQQSLRSILEVNVNRTAQDLKEVNSKIPNTVEQWKKIIIEEEIAVYDDEKNSEELRALNPNMKKIVVNSIDEMKKEIFKTITECMQRGIAPHQVYINLYSGLLSNLKKMIDDAPENYQEYLKVIFEKNLYRVAQDLYKQNSCSMSFDTFLSQFRATFN